MKLDLRNKYNVWGNDEGNKETVSFYSLTRDILSEQTMPESIILTLEQVLYLDQVRNQLTFDTPLPLHFRGIPIEIISKEVVIQEVPKTLPEQIVNEDLETIITTNN